MRSHPGRVFAVVVDLVGWAGGVLAAVAYVLAVTKRIDVGSRAYQVLNVIGGGSLTASSLYHGALSNAVVNGVWIGFAVHAMVTTTTTAADRGGP